MRRLLFYFLILLLAVWLGLKMQADPGYVLVAYGHTSLETTLWFAVLALFVVGVFWYFLLRVIAGSRVLPRRIARWWHNKKERKSIQLTNIGLLKLAEEEFSLAEKCLAKAAKTSPNTFLNYCEAAYAASQQGAFLRRDHYLKLAMRAADHREEFALNLMQARLQIGSQQWEQALANLKRLSELKPKQRAVLRLLKRVYVAVADWSALYDLLPAIQKLRVLPQDAFAVLEKQVAEELLLKMIAVNEGATPNSATVAAFWQSLAKHLQHEISLISPYVKYLVAQHEHERAEKLLHTTLEQIWQPELLELYSSIVVADPIKQLAVAERWLEKHPEDAKLLFALGKLCKRQTLWGKARGYLTKSLKIEPRAATYFELGQIMEVEGDLRGAMEAYRKSFVTIQPLDGTHTYGQS